MGFSLTVQEGTNVGHQENFDQPEVTIGRTSDNVLVLLDPGVSRKHASIVQERGKIFIQDLGSANGVTINGQKISRHELRSGDKISLGPVVLLFEETAKARSAQRRARSISPEQSLALEKETRRGTMTMQAARKSRENPVSEELAPVSRRGGGQSMAQEGRRRRAVASGADEETGQQGRKRSQVQQSALSASERARILRENKGLSGKIKLYLAEQPPAKRNAIMGGMAVLGLLVICAIGVMIVNQVGKTEEVAIAEDFSEKAFSLSDSQAKKVFGYGDEFGVTTPTRYELKFNFEVSETIPAIYYLYFESKGIETADEVTITLNSVPLGNVSAGLGDYSKTQKMRLPKKHLVPGNINEVMFDHMGNTRTAGQETWAIAGVNLQMVPLPGCDVRSGECEREAHKHYEIAEKMWSGKDMAAENSYNALKNLNTSLLFLEAVDPKPDFARAVQQMIREVERHLDSICSKTLLQVKRNEEMRNYQRVVDELKSGLMWYPGSDHHCRAKLEEMLSEYE